MRYERRILFIAEDTLHKCFPHDRVTCQSALCHDTGQAIFVREEQLERPKPRHVCFIFPGRNGAISRGEPTYSNQGSRGTKSCRVDSGSISGQEQANKAIY